MARERYGVGEDELEIERTRLTHLAASLDPKTQSVLTQLGLGTGHSCWELGAGAGTVAAWMADQVSSSGRVWSTDIELRFHGDVPAHVNVEQHDVVNDAVPHDAFDFVHARAVLQHIPEREAVLDRLVQSCKHGGWIVIEDGDSSAFAAQPLPEPYAKVHRIMASGEATPWRDANYGSRLIGALRARTLVDVDCTGGVRTMRPGESNGEWWFLAVERGGPLLVEAGLITQSELEQAIVQMRAPGFVMLSPLSLAVWGRRR